MLPCRWVCCSSTTRPPSTHRAPPLSASIAVLAVNEHRPKRDVPPKMSAAPPRRATQPTKLPLTRTRCAVANHGDEAACVVAMRALHLLCAWHCCEMCGFVLLKATQTRPAGRIMKGMLCTDHKKDVTMHVGRCESPPSVDLPHLGVCCPTNPSLVPDGDVAPPQHSTDSNNSSIDSSV